MSTLTSATIFKDRARLTRTQPVTLNVGLQKIDFTHLPLTLIPASLRAKGTGKARAKLLGVTSRQEHYVETPAEAVRALEEKIQKLDDTDAELSAQASVLEKERTTLEEFAGQNETWARGVALRGRTVTEQGELLDFVAARTHKINAQILKIIRERRELVKEKDRTQRELQGAQSARPKQRWVATVELEVQQAGDLDLELSYMLTGASWTPMYDIRLAEQTLEVTYLAQVRQNTGEDWNKVQLSLSTAEPSLILHIPELEAWYIQPRSESPARAPQAKGGVAAPAPAPMAAPAPRRMTANSDFYDGGLEIAAAAISESGANLTYTLTAAADVPGNNDPHKVIITTFNLKPNLDYVTAPKTEALCFRRAKVKNESAYSLLAGTAQLFEGDTYLGATALEFVAPQQDFELALGADERLRVERKKTLHDVDKNFMGDRRTTRYGYKIEVENLRDKPHTIFVRDQLPVPRDEQIKVKLETCDPKATTLTELNQLEWKLTLNANTKQTLKYEFSVEHPKTMLVVGLP